MLRDTRHLDFSAIMEEAVRALVASADLQCRLADRIRHVIVDEYQDVNPIQEALVRLLANLGANICVVGDDDQTIYQWRGSNVQNILSFASRYPPVKEIRLQENFRSSEGIVKTAREFIAQNVERLPKGMIPTTEQPYEAGDLVALSFGGPEEESAYIAETIQSLVGVSSAENESEPRGLAYADMAVLLRSVRTNGEAIARALDAAGIPYVVGGMNRLFATPEAQAARELFGLSGTTSLTTPRTSPTSSSPRRPSRSTSAAESPWRAASTRCDARTRARPPSSTSRAATAPRPRRSPRPSSTSMRWGTGSSRVAMRTTWRSTTSTSAREAALRR